MCGVLFQYRKGNDISLERFSHSLSLQKHRGPDHQGIVFTNDRETREFRSFFKTSNENKNDQVHMAFGHQRLSIVDLSSNSNQPVVSNKNNIMIFNGEFYNFLEHVQTKETAKSDTLTLCHILEEKGFVALNDVNGMYGLCYYIAETNKLFLARDRFGKKPLYYYQDNEQFIASSEIKSIFSLLDSQKRQVESLGLVHYLYGKQTPFLNNGETFYSLIKTVKPGQVLSLCIESLKITDLGTIGFDDKKNIRTQHLCEDQCYKNLHDDVERAVKIRLKSEVPLTILASGGIDSTFVAGAAKKNLTSSNNLSLYTCEIVTNDGKITDDLYYARALAKELKLPLNEVAVEKTDETEFMKIAKLLTRQVELPLNLFLSTIPTYLMTKSMAERGIKVVLDGIGGDEIMGGYPAYSSLAFANASGRNLMKAYNYFSNWRDFSKSELKDQLQMLKSLAKVVIKGKPPASMPEQLHDVLSPYMYTSHLNDQAYHFISQYFDRHKMTSATDIQLFEIEKYQLPYYLGIADQMSMINSVENRSPFLDKNLYQYIFMPEKFKFRAGFNKFALRKALPDNIPDMFRWREGKIGIGNAFLHGLVTKKEPLECIMDSNFIGSFIKVDKLFENRGHKHFESITRPLLSLALLDDTYRLHF